MTTAAWSENWMNNWLSSQQRYWDAWSEMVQTGMSSSKNFSGTNMWTEGLDRWWKAVSPQAPDPVNEMFQRVIDMGKNYLSMAEQALGATTGNAADKAMDAWFKAMTDGFQRWTQQLESGMDSAVPDMFGIGKTSLDAWQRMVTGMTAGMPSSMSGLEMPGVQGMQEQFKRMLDTPALGYLREYQERMQALSQKFLDYQEAMLAYKLAFAKMGQRSVQALQTRMLELSSKNEDSIKTLRGMYDLWVDVSEEIYSEFAMSDEYQVVYGDLVNALMKLRQGMNELAEQGYKAMHLPTRSDMDALQRRQQELRRENHALRRELKALNARIDGIVTQSGTSPSENIIK
jgi:class III poly(R)-hydroxyalkanoic acid synthase PhaE subunit